VAKNIALTEIKRLVAIAVALSPASSFAQSSDAAYCAKLADLMNVYLGGDMGHPTITDPDIAIAIDRCQKGDTASGIPVLERKLRAIGYTLPKR
jgi:hypothetical protein